MTDYRHVQGFKLQGMILCNLLSAVINPNLVGSNLQLLNMASGGPHQMSSNREYVTALLKKILCDNFPNLNHVQVETFVTKLFNSV